MHTEKLKSTISKALGQARVPLVFKNGKIINVFTSEIIPADIAIFDGKIIGIGDYEGDTEIDLAGQYVAPGLIDAHVHMESAMSTPGQFARAVLPRGVTSVIADPHEIANVQGLAGIEFMIASSQGTPLDAYFMLPSCVPATPFESAGAILKAQDLAELMDHPQVLGLGEMMDYPGLLTQRKDILEKLLLASGKIIDGHSPMLTGKDLNAYVAAGVQTDHEASTLDEVMERIRLGMYILIRQGSAAKDLPQLLPAITKDNLGQFLFCTDDKHPKDLLEEGSIDYNIRLAIQLGLAPMDAIKIASLHAARCYGLKGKGAIAPGYDADLVLLDDLENFHVTSVYKAGKLVAKDGQALFDVTEEIPPALKNTVHIQPVTQADLKIKIQENQARVIGIREGSLLTDCQIRQVSTREGYFDYDKDGILKLAVIERHKASGNIGLGLIENFGLRNGAIATTIAHDSHNMIVIGDNDEDMLLAIKEVTRIQGGIALISGGQVLQSLALPIGGILSDQPIEKTDRLLQEMAQIAHEKLDVQDHIDPFMTLSFMALPVIPRLKLTDQGLFDVDSFTFIPISEEI